MKKLVLKTAMGIVFLAAGCDIIEKDVAPSPKPKESLSIYSAPNQSVIIDLQRIFPDYQSVDVSGNQNVTAHQNRYIKYKPESTINDFSFNLRGKLKENRVNVNVSALGRSNTCSDNEAFTYASITNTSALVVNLLNNPEFCEFDIYKPTEIGIAESRQGVDESQNTDGVLIEICACSDQGTHAILTYVPPAGFVGQVKFKYYLHAGASNATINTYGQEVYYDPKYSKFFSAHNVVIDVTAPL
jgi:hypothetical protein